jgi:hypothetical protein
MSFILFYNDGDDERYDVSMGYRRHLGTESSRISTTFSNRERLIPNLLYLGGVCSVRARSGGRIGWRGSAGFDDGTVEESVHSDRLAVPLKGVRMSDPDELVMNKLEELNRKE